jgi:inhibitor of cysteine peptidase
MNRHARWTLAALAAASLCACAPATTSGDARPPSPQTLRLSEGDSGSTVSAWIGDTLEVELMGNPSTGFTWEPASVPQPVLERVGEARFTPDSSAIGAGGRITLRYRAAQAGQVQLALAYRRAFEAAVPPARTFSLNVTVR